MPEFPVFLTPQDNGDQAEDTVVRWRTVSNRALGIWSGGGDFAGWGLADCLSSAESLASRVHFLGR